MDVKERLRKALGESEHAPQPRKSLNKKESLKRVRDHIEGAFTREDDNDKPREN